MIKKLLAFACCVAPFGGAVAGVTIIDPATTPGANQMENPFVVSTGDYARVVSGGGLVLDAGMTVGSLYVGQNSTEPVSPAGEVFIETTAANNYTIRSDGNVSITSMLEVLSGHSLGIAAKTDGGTISNVSVGAIDAAGSLVMQDVGTLATGTITTNNNLDLTANAFTVTGNVNSNGGNTTIDVANAFTITNSFINNGGAQTEIGAGSVSVGSLQNQNGSVKIESGGAITSSGNFENFGAGTTIDITGTNMVVGGTMQNNTGSTMTLNLDSLRINGGAGDNASFVNKGDLEINVSGETRLANGFDLSTMGTANSFSLTTGTLVLGGGADSLSQVFENNKLTSFKLIVNDGDITANNITNGADNPAANMTMAIGGDIVATTIQNNGDKLNISTIENSDGNIQIGNVGGTSISGVAASTTTIVADGTLSATGAVSNNGTMTLNGNEIELVSVSNAGTLTIASQTDSTGQIHLSGGVNNSAGTTNINARQIAIDGIVETTGGTTTVRGSDANNGASVVVGGIKASGGVTNLDALIGGATISGDLLATNGAFNVGPNIHELNVNGGTQISGDLTFSGTNATGAGNVNVANSGNTRFVLTSNNPISITGNVVAQDAAIARTGTLVANVIEVGGDVTVANKGNIAFGDSNSGTLAIGGDVTANNGGTIEIYSDATTLNSLSGNGKFIMHGDSVSATTGTITASNGIWYDGTNPAAGMIINDTDAFTLQTQAQDVTVTGGMSIADGILNIISAKDATISGDVGVSSDSGVLNVTANAGAVQFNNEISATDGGAVTVNGLTVTTAAITVDEDSSVSLGGAGSNSVTTNGLVSNAGDLDVIGKQVTMASLVSTDGTTDITATTNALQIASVDVSGGLVNLQGTAINSTSMSLSGGTTKLSSGTITVDDDIDVSNGDLNQGGSVGVMILNNGGTLAVDNLTVGGKLVVDGNSVIYNITNDATFSDGIDGNAGTATINADVITVGGAIVNAANLTLNTGDDLSLGVVQNTGALVLNTTNGTITATSLSNTAGTTTITSDDMTLTGALTASGILYQNYADALGAGDINITPTDYTLTAPTMTVGGIRQNGASAMTIVSDDVTVNGNIVANDLRVEATTAGNWLDVDVLGSVSGGVDFVGLKHMHIGGNYTYDDNSMLHAAVLANPGAYNYWSTVSLADDNTYGQITNAATNAAPIISVDGNFVYNVSNGGAELSDSPLVNPQIGIDIFDMVDTGTAIWLLHADGPGGLTELADKIRNLNVNFCNADGTRCFKYFDNVIAETAAAGQTEQGLPAYLAVRDIDDDGVTDSIYIVFDSDFGGPVEVFKIQPLVARVDDHTRGEYDAAGGLDDMIDGQLYDTGFYNRVPIEAIPVAFGGTNLEQLGTELYNRMERYTENRVGTPLARFSRLVEPNEIQQVMGAIALDEHVTFRDMEDRMLDEFIWNRHRSLKKAWVDVDYGLFYQNIGNGGHSDGDRFSITGGFDWQHNSTLILGLAAHVAHTAADNTDTIDLTYTPESPTTGRVHTDVADTKIGVGAYLMKTLGTKARVYGNGFLDLHFIDISREQTFMANIDGSATAFSIISEWGLLHDWLNQYIVGNLYARVGYNFGFSVHENAGGAEYMHLKYDDYAIFTPGYSLIAQKRIYPTSWFQIRPYASIGVEYDVLGSPNVAEFKFGPAKGYREYDIEIDPLWANIGGGVELLSATGFQLGLDYRYQYNDDIQLHKLKLSLSYRF